MKTLSFCFPIACGRNAACVPGIPLSGQVICTGLAIKAFSSAGLHVMIAKETYCGKSKGFDPVVFNFKA
jgi:hypothetical protein